MKHLFVAKAAVLVATAGLTVPPQQMTAAEPAAAVSERPSSATAIRDVELSANGVLEGAALNGQGRGVAKQPVVVVRDGRVVAEAVSDEDGQFAVKGLRGGVYQVAAGEMATVVRVWSNDTAPPTAGKGILLAPEEAVVRGQQRIGDVFKSRAFIVGSIIAAAVAIPVIVHNSRDDSSDDDDDSSS